MIFRLWTPAVQAATEVILDQEASLEDWKALFETEEFKRALEGR